MLLCSVFFVAFMSHRQESPPCFNFNLNLYKSVSFFAYSCQASGVASANRLTLSPQLGDVLADRSRHKSLPYKSQSVGDAVAPSVESDTVRAGKW